MRLFLFGTNSYGMAHGAWRMVHGAGGQTEEEKAAKVVRLIKMLKADRFSRFG
jgi:hypothetical protein